MASLIVVAGPNEGDYYPIDQDALVLGRDDQCDIQILDEMISRRHLRVRRESEDRFHAEDLESANGVVVNGHRIASATVLADRDMIEIGGTRILFTLREFPHRKSAWEYYKLLGEGDRGTLIR